MQQQREIEGTEAPELLVLGGRRRQRPAQVLVVTSNDPYRLRKFLARERKRRSITNVSDIVEVEGRPGVWAAKVTQLRPIRPAWVRPVVVAGAVTSGVTGLAGLGWWLMSLIVSAAAGVSAGELVLALAFSIVAYRLLRRGNGGGRGSECRVDVSVIHRH